MSTDGSFLKPLPLNNCSVSPHSPFNLLSVSQLNKDNINVRMSNRGDYLEFDGFRYRCLRLYGLYLIDLMKPLHAYTTVSKTKAAMVSFVEMDDSYSLNFGGLAATLSRWHDRLGHVSTKSIKALAASGLSEGLHINKDEPHNAKCKCTVCLATNNVKHHIPDVRQFVTDISQKGQLVTSDVMGPYPTSPEGHRYAVSYIDEFSRYSVVYFLKAKSEVPNTLHAVVRYFKSLGIIIQKIRTDQGGEFGGHHQRDTPSGGLGKHTPGTSEESNHTAYAKVCAQYEIVHEPYPAYTPQLNGVAERWNRTVMTMANSMMYNARAHPTLWTFAAAHANHLRNRLPTSIRSGHTPYELFHNRRPRYDNLRIWGSYCYKLLPVRTKIPGLPVRKQLIYVGEAADSIGFRCFNPNTHELTTEYELLFDEDEVSRRHETLHAYDNRRELAASGDYDQIPLIYRADHSAENQSRKAYSTDLHTSRRGPNSDGSPQIDIGRPLSFKSVASIINIEISPPTVGNKHITKAGSLEHVSLRSASNSGVKSKVLCSNISEERDRISSSECLHNPCTLHNSIKTYDFSPMYVVSDCLS